MKKTNKKNVYFQYKHLKFQFRIKKENSEKKTQSTDRTANI